MIYQLVLFKFWPQPVTGIFERNQTQKPKSSEQNTTMETKQNEKWSNNLRYTYHVPTSTSPVKRLWNSSSRSASRAMFASKGSSELQAALNTKLASLSPKITLLLSEFDSEPSSDEKDEELEEHSISFHSIY